MYFPRAHHDRQPSSTDLLLVMNWLFRNVFGFTQPASIPHRKLALSSFCCCGGGAQRYYYYYYYYHPHHWYAHLLLLLFTVSQSAIHPSDHPSNDLPVGYPKNSMPWDRQMNYIYLPVIHKYHFYLLSPASSLTYSYSDSVGRRQTGRDDDDEDGASFRKTIIHQSVILPKWCLIWTPIPSSISIAHVKMNVTHYIWCSSLPHMSTITLLIPYH